MDEATRNAESIKQDIVALQKRFITIDAGEKCSVCGLALLTRQFYVFPCRHTFHADCLIGLTKEYLPATALRKIIALQSELVKLTQGAPLDRGITNPTSLLPPSSVHTRQNSTAQRTLLSATFQNGHSAKPSGNGAGAAAAANALGLGRNILSAGDRLRDLIVPDTLVSVVTAPAGWIPGIGAGSRRNTEKDAEKKVEKLRAELEDVLTGTCPLCESVVAGVDKPFVKEGERDTSWEL